MHKIICVAFLFLNSAVFGQKSVRIILQDLSANKATKVFIAGSFNNWTPGAAAYAMQKTDSNKWEILLKDIPNGTLNFKFTQGSWETEEVTAKGDNVENHYLKVESDSSIKINIYGWKSQPLQPKKHTASKNVYTVSDSFYVPQLNRYRKVIVYLPANYNSSKERYPVLYMHDGQNLFDEYFAPFGEWGIDEALDTLQNLTGKYAIIVGIDNGIAKRITEYNFEDNKKYGVAEGQLYIDFLATVLKPFIDKKYRTKTEKVNTAIAGSSLGGLISTYAVLKYPKTFGTAGIFSPAFWIASTIDSVTKSVSKKIANRFWFYAGEKESADMVENMMMVKNNLQKNSKNNFSFNVDVAGAHNEQTWRKWFPAFYLWWVKADKE